MTTPITGALVVCVAAAGVAAGALFLQVDDPSTPTPAGSTPAPTASADNGGYGSSDGGGDAGATADPAGASLEISGFQFGTASVGAGGQVTVANRDSASHTVTANSGEFDTGEVSGGGTSAFVAPSAPGSYEFQCQIHPDMTGTLTVG
jgi:plastocyanin